VQHRSRKAQADLTVIRARAGLVRARTALINTARGLTKSYGERLRGCSPRKMNGELAQGLSPELQSALQPLLEEIGSLSERIREYNEAVKQIAQESYPEVARLEQVKGIGTLIALTYVLTWKIQVVFARVVTSVVIWGYDRGGGTRGRASRNCTSARRETRIYERCWCKARTRRF